MGVGVCLGTLCCACCPRGIFVTSAASWKRLPGCSCRGVLSSLARTGLDGRTGRTGRKRRWTDTLENQQPLV